MRTCTKENGTHYYETGAWVARLFTDLRAVSDAACKVFLQFLADFKIGVSFGGLAIKARIENADGVWSHSRSLPAGKHFSTIRS